MASSKKTTASLFNNMSSLGNKIEEESTKQNKIETDQINTTVESDEKISTVKELTKKPIEQETAPSNKPEIKAETTDKINTGKKTVSFTTPGEIKDKLQRYSIAFPDSISQYITDLIIKDFNENEEKYEEIATLLEKVKGLR